MNLTWVKYKPHPGLNLQGHCVLGLPLLTGAMRSCGRNLGARSWFPRACALPRPASTPAVVRTSDLAAVGIDAQPHGPLPPGVGASVTVAQEREMLGRLTRTGPSIQWDRLLFSAKEAIYKAWNPLTHRWLGFETPGCPSIRRRGSSPDTC